MRRCRSLTGPGGRSRRRPGRTTHLHRGILEHDPLPWLLSADDPAITALVKRDLLGERVEITRLWELREPLRLIGRQQKNGSWRYPVKKASPFNYDLYETFNILGILVAKYRFDKRHPSIERGARYVFSCQTTEGDYRGIYGRQPAHTYTAALMEVLIEAGYHQHPSIERAFRWLLDSRQDDGGWAIPARTRGRRWDTSRRIQAATEKPFSHMVTGMVLRAFAAHPRHRRTRAARDAADLLKSRFFKPDKYADRRGREFWTRFTYPFGYTDLLTSLDSLGRMGFGRADPDIELAIEWFRKKQNRDGSFSLEMRRGVSDKRLPHWLGFAVCRALSRFRALDSTVAEERTGASSSS